MNKESILLARPAPGGINDDCWQLFEENENHEINPIPLASGLLQNFAEELALRWNQYTLTHTVPKYERYEPVDD